MEPVSMEKDNCHLRQMDETVEYYLGSISAGSRIIYISIVTICFLVLITMFFIKLRIFISAQGIIRPEAENSCLRSLAAGKVDRILVREGQAVGAGDTLLMLDCRHLEHNLGICRESKYELEAKIRDIEHIHSGYPEKIVTAGISYSYQQFSDSYRAARIRYEKAGRERERQERLFRDSLISEKDFDDLVHAEKILNNEMAVIISTYYSGLEQLYDQLTVEYRETILKEESLLKEISNSCIIAPVSGYLVEFSGIYKGSDINAGQLLLTISPDTSLVAEIYLPPSGAGYIFTGQEARIFVDSYNYREWGSLSAVVKEISSDVLVINANPYYRIKCAMTDDMLRLKNGTAGRLRQGMTFRARLFLNKRTLMQIIFDRVEKWILPGPKAK